MSRSKFEDARSERSAKIAIASSGENLESQVDPRFGRCPYFLIGDSETEEFEAIENKAGQAPRGAGVAAAQLVANRGVGAVIAGNFGPNAISALSASKIKIFAGVSGITAKEGLERFKDGKLKETIAATAVPLDRGRRGGWK